MAKGVLHNHIEHGAVLRGQIDFGSEDDYLLTKLNFGSTFRIGILIANEILS